MESRRLPTRCPLRSGTAARYLAREFLLDGFSVADAYLTTVLNWAPYGGLDLTPWPAVKGYYERMVKRPSIARAIGEEFALYKEEEARRKRA